MSETTFKPGDRVSGGALFGCGDIVGDLCGLPGFWRVHFDRTPPMEYCMGQNPCAVTSDQIRHATPEDEEASRLALAASEGEEWVLVVTARVKVQQLAHTAAQSAATPPASCPPAPHHK
jgi:hypothetical protein